MENFKGTKWEGLTEEEIFQDTQHLVKSTIYKKFSNYKKFCKQHLLEFDDIVQIGNIGLLYAIRTFKPENGAFTTYAINNIGWAILSQSKYCSLRTINKKSFDLRKMISMETTVSGGDSGGSKDGEQELTIEDTIASNEDVAFLVEEKVFEDQVIDFIHKDPRVNNELANIIIERIKGVPISTLAEKLGITPSAVYIRLKSKRAKQLKQRLLEFLEAN